MIVPSRQESIIDVLSNYFYCYCVNFFLLDCTFTFNIKIEICDINCFFWSLSVSRDEINLHMKCWCSQRLENTEIKELPIMTSRCVLRKTENISESFGKNENELVELSVNAPKTHDSSSCSLFLIEWRYLTSCKYALVYRF